MSITGGPRRGPLTDVASMWVGLSPEWGSQRERESLPPSLLFPSIAPTLVRPKNSAMSTPTQKFAKYPSSPGPSSPSRPRGRPELQCVSLDVCKVATHSHHWRRPFKVTKFVSGKNNKQHDHHHRGPGLASRGPGKRPMAKPLTNPCTK